MELQNSDRKELLICERIKIKVREDELLYYTILSPSPLCNHNCWSLQSSATPVQITRLYGVAAEVGFVTWLNLSAKAVEHLH